MKKPINEPPKPDEKEILDRVLRQMLSMSPRPRKKHGEEAINAASPRKSNAVKSAKKATISAEDAEEMKTQLAVEKLKTAPPKQGGAVKSRSAKKL